MAVTSTRALFLWEKPVVNIVICFRYDSVINPLYMT